MQDIPILEIDCNEDFHENDESKSALLQQVKSLLKTPIICLQGAWIRPSSAGETTGEAQLSQRDWLGSGLVLPVWLSAFRRTVAQSASFFKGVEDVANPVANVEAVKTD